MFVYNVCVCPCMFVYTCVWLYVCLSICVFVYNYVCLSIIMHVCLYACFLYMCLLICMFVYIFMYVFNHACTCMPVTRTSHPASLHGRVRSLGSDTQSLDYKLGYLTDHTYPKNRPPCLSFSRKGLHPKD